MNRSISVVIAAYHGEKYIGEQLKSLFAQTRVPDEILIGDDSDDDATSRAVEAVRGDFSGRLEHVRNPVQLGVVRNFAELAGRASGDLIFFCDQDDFWLPEKIETLARALENHPDIQAAACNSFMADENLRPSGESLLSYASGFLPPGYEGKVPFRPVLLQQVNFSGHNMAMKRSFLDTFLRIPDDYRFHDLWLEQTAALHDALFCVNRELTLYRLHSGNTSSPVFERTRRSFLHRLKETAGNTGDLRQTFLMLEGLSRLAETETGLPPENLKLLRDYHAYFRARNELRSRPRFLRALFLKPELLRGYFDFGTGWHSLCRDLFL